MVYEAEFESWWSGCWLKVGKLAARREYERARKVHKATAEQLIAGREAYKRNKPAWAEWVHPRTWLHQGRWTDEWNQPPLEPKEDWFDECKRIHNGECDLNRQRHYQRKAMDEFRKEFGPFLSQQKA